MCPSAHRAEEWRKMHERTPLKTYTRKMVQIAQRGTLTPGRVCVCVAPERADAGVSIPPQISARTRARKRSATPEHPRVGSETRRGTQRRGAKYNLPLYPPLPRLITTAPDTHMRDEVGKGWKKEGARAGREYSEAEAGEGRHLWARVLSHNNKSHGKRKTKEGRSVAYSPRRGRHTHTQVQALQINMKGI